MRVIAKSTLIAFCDREPENREALESLSAWYSIASKAHWATFADIRADYPSSSWVGNNRVVFNICNNRFRLIVKVSFAYGRVLIRFVGTHQEYDRVNASEV